jgi:Family of unknown function (DUF6345)
MADPPFIPGIENILAIDGVGGITPVSPISPAGTSVPSVSTGRGKTAPVEVGAYWINHYKRCGQTRTDFCNALAARFAAAMRAKGHTVAFIRSEQDASPRQWDAWGDKSAAGIDTVEFVFLATHSGTHGFERRGSNWLFWWLATFDSPDGCIVSTIRLDGNWAPVTPATPVVTMRLGEGRLRWAVLDGCRSLQLGVENERDQNARANLAESNPERTWRRCFDGVNMLFGFTGLSSDASWTADRGLSFGYRAGRGEALANSWVDEAYSYWVNDVPVALACGQSEADADRRLKKESLKAVGQRLRAGNIGGFKWLWRS